MSRRIAAAIAACGALLLVPQALPASAAPTAVDGGSFVEAPSGPPVGKAWLVGVITDQAGHPLQDVNVEAWPSDDPDATAPTASDRTYENVADEKQGYFRLEVPIHANYLIVVSADPADLYRTFQYNDGDPIKVGVHKVRTLGTSEIALVERQESTIKAKIKPGKVKAGKTVALTVAVNCAYVAPVTGKIGVTIDDKAVKFKKPVKLSHGKAVVTLKAPASAGKHDVVVTYLGDSYVKKSTKTLTLKVKK